MSASKSDRDVFEALLERSGLKVSEAQKKDLFIGYGHILACAERVRAGGKRSREAEPDHTFDARFETKA